LFFNQRRKFDKNKNFSISLLLGTKLAKKNMQRRKIKGSILAIIGYVLSPLSWWNDIFVNIPLAYVFALPFGFISRNLFLPAMVLGYWITNIIGLVLMRYGVVNLVSKEKKKYTRKELVKDLAVSLIYTIVIIILVSLGLLKFPTEYL